jgi:hypothetical protein
MKSCCKLSFIFMSERSKELKKSVAASSECLCVSS